MTTMKNDGASRRARSVLRRSSGVTFRNLFDTGPSSSATCSRAGLGWFGKNTNLVNPRLGSFSSSAHCGGSGSCPRHAVRSRPLRDLHPLSGCMPHRRVRQPRLLAATRCSPISRRAEGRDPEDLREQMGNTFTGATSARMSVPTTSSSPRASRAAFAPRASIAERTLGQSPRIFWRWTTRRFRATFRTRP